MSGLVCLNDSIFNLKDLSLVQKSEHHHRFIVKLVDGTSFFISDSEFTLLHIFISKYKHDAIELSHPKVCKDCLLLKKVLSLQCLIILMGAVESIPPSFSLKILNLLK